MGIPDGQRLIVAVHRRRGTPLVWCWDNLHDHRSCYIGASLLDAARCLARYKSQQT
jgi:hypothetical protein